MPSEIKRLTARDAAKWKRTPEEVTELARDIVTNRVFITTGARGEPMESIFMPLMMLSMTEAAIKQIGALYEYVDKAGPRSVNGYPMFTSMRFVHADNMDLLRSELDRMKAALV